MALERFRGRARRPLAPELVDQPVARDRLVRVQKKEDKESPLLPGTERKHSIAVSDLDRPEDPELHEVIVPPLPGPYQRSYRAVGGRSDPVPRASEPFDEKEE